MIRPAQNPARARARGLLLMWPVGLALVVANMEVPAVTWPVFLALDAVYVAVAFLLLRGIDTRADRSTTALAASGVALFATVGFTGGPTATEPALMMVNTAALLVIAIGLLLASVMVVAERLAGGSGAPVLVAVPGLVLLAVGTTIYCANLIARFAVVFSGASDQQAAVEDTSWIAFEYLRGLPPAPGFMGYLLVWFDLLQLGYVVTAYLCAAGLARMVRAQGSVAQPLGWFVERAAYVLASMIVLGVALAAVLPRELDLVPAWAAFIASIPFMTTLLPAVLGAGLLAAGRPRGAGSLVEAEAQLDGDLPVRDRTVGDLSADALHLEPVEVSHRLGGLGHGVRDGGLDTVR